MNAVTHDRFEAFAIEDVGCVDNRMSRRQAVGTCRWRGGIAGGQCPGNFTVADGIDQHPFAANQIEHRQI
jgi:hypothetical protein